VPSLDHDRSPAGRPRRRSVAARVRPHAGARRSEDHRHRRASTPRVAARRPPHVDDRRPAPDRGLGLLTLFTAGVLAMVALITLTAIVGSWWVLVAVLVVDFGVTAAVLASIAKLLEN